MNQAQRDQVEATELAKRLQGVLGKLSSARLSIMERHLAREIERRKHEPSGSLPYWADPDDIYGVTWEPPH